MTTSLSEQSHRSTPPTWIFLKHAEDYHHIEFLAFRSTILQFITMAKPFHRLLTFYANRSPRPNKQTIRLVDSLHGNLALGLDFPVALAVALTRHLFLRNTGVFSLSIYIPTVTTEKTLLHGVPTNEKHNYSRSESYRWRGRKRDGLARPTPLECGAWRRMSGWV